MIYNQIYDFLMQTVFSGVNSPPVEWVEMLSTCLSTAVVFVPVVAVCALIGWMFSLILGR